MYLTLSTAITERSTGHLEKKQNKNRHCQIAAITSSYTNVPVFKGERDWVLCFLSLLFCFSFSIFYHIFLSSAKTDYLRPECRSILDRPDNSPAHSWSLLSRLSYSCLHNISSIDSIFLLAMQEQQHAACLVHPPFLPFHLTNCISFLATLVLW